MDEKWIAARGGNDVVDKLIGLGLMVQRSKVHEVVEARREGRLVGMAFNAASTAVSSTVSGRRRASSASRPPTRSSSTSSR